MTEIEDNTGSPVIKVAFLDVGQGDTIVISCPETREAFVVDCIDADAVLDYLEQEQVRFLRGIIVTHLHADHYSRVADLLNNCTLVPGLSACEVLIYNEFLKRKDLERLREDEDMHSSSTDPSFLKETALEDLRRWTAGNKRKCSEMKLGAGASPFNGPINIKALHPYFADYSKLQARGLNNTSIVLRVSGPGASALLTGDLEPAGWRALLENHPDIRSDILKFPHHGGRWNTSDTESLLNTVQPSVIILSVGTDGGEKYGHPNREVFEILASSEYSHIQVFCTQATNQCYGSFVNQRASIVQRLDKFAHGRGQEVIGSKRGCPCAGTVVLELGNNISYVQPSQTFHRNSIILPHFSTHKCIFP